MVLPFVDLRILSVHLVEDVDRRLAFHPRQDRVPIEDRERVHDGVIGVLDDDLAIVGLSQEDRTARLHAGAIAHRFGDDDLALGPDLGRPKPIERNPGTKRREGFGLTHPSQYNHICCVPPLVDLWHRARPTARSSAFELADVGLPLSPR